MDKRISWIWLWQIIALLNESLDGFTQSYHHALHPDAISLLIPLPLPVWLFLCCSYQYQSKIMKAAIGYFCGRFIACLPLTSATCCFPFYLNEMHPHPAILTLSFLTRPHNHLHLYHYQHCCYQNWTS